MNVLANALPGFRELRAPLIAGYLWLLFAYLLIAPDFDVGHPPELLEPLVSLGEDVGPVGVGIGASLAAYLLGAVSQILSEPLRRVSGLVRRVARGGPAPGTELIERVRADSEPRVARRLAKPADALGGKHQALFTALQPIEIELGELDSTDNETEPRKAQLEDAWHHAQAWRDNGMAYAGVLDDLETEADNRHREFEREAFRELSLPASLLIAGEKELFAEADRMRAEGELRLAAVPPLMCLTALFSIRLSPWCALALLVLLVLTYAGSRRLDESLNLTERTFEASEKQLSSVARLTAWFDEFSAEVERRLAEVDPGEPPIDALQRASFIPPQ